MAIASLKAIADGVSPASGDSSASGLADTNSIPSRANSSARYLEVEPKTIFFFKINDFLTFPQQNHIMSANEFCVQNMSPTINIDRFTRLKQTVTGKFKPQELPNLAEYLAGEEGEINYSLVGRLVVDLTGSQERRVKCIIYGWFLLSDPVTLAAVRHTLDINSSLILVKDESELPPLEMESDSEDYIVCGANMQVAERVEEEILLSLPAHAVRRSETIDSRDVRSTENKVASVVGKSPTAAKVSEAPASAGKKISPFAKLAELKKK